MTHKKPSRADGWQIHGWNMGLIGARIAMFADLTIRGVLFLGRFIGGKWQTVRV